MTSPLAGMAKTAERGFSEKGLGHIEISQACNGLLVSMKFHVSFSCFVGTGLKKLHRNLKYFYKTQSCTHTYLGKI